MSIFPHAFVQRSVIEKNTTQKIRKQNNLPHKLKISNINYFVLSILYKRITMNTIMMKLSTIVLALTMMISQGSAKLNVRNSYILTNIFIGCIFFLTSLLSFWWTGSTWFSTCLWWQHSRCPGLECSQSQKGYRRLTCSSRWVSHILWEYVCQHWSLDGYLCQRCRFLHVWIKRLRTWTSWGITSLCFIWRY